MQCGVSWACSYPLETVSDVSRTLLVLPQRNMPSSSLSPLEEQLRSVFRLRAWPPRLPPTCPASDARRRLFPDPRFSRGSSFASAICCALLAPPRQARGNSVGEPSFRAVAARFNPIAAHDRNDLGRVWFAPAVCRPCLHQVAALLEEIAALVSALDAVAHGMGKCELCRLAWEVRRLGCPLSKGGKP